MTFAEFWLHLGLEISDRERLRYHYYAKALHAVVCQMRADMSATAWARTPFVDLVARADELFGRPMKLLG